MKEFFKITAKFAKSYWKNLSLAVFLNVLCALFNIFSFSLLVPLLNILFKTGGSKTYAYYPFESSGTGFIAWLKEFVEWGRNAFNWMFQQMMEQYGASTSLLFIGLFFIFMTFLRCITYFGGSAIMIPIRTGFSRDLRTQIYDKILALPISFFSDERKGDIVARMGGDVNEVENSIMSSLDMLLKNPILILGYFTALMIISWKLTLFTLAVVPLMAWGMGALGRTLKKNSLKAQNRWSDTMSQLDETLGGLRIIKAFNAEEKMSRRFRDICNDFKKLLSRVVLRQSSAHPVSEFLGTIMIMLVLWFGGTLVLKGSDMIDASLFIFYLVILYQSLQPIKELSRTSYNIPRGLASMERVNKILLADNSIKDPENPKEIDGFHDCIEFKDVCFSYNTEREVLTNINLTIPKGKTIAIVGQSGSGKSTLVDLIARYYDVNSGSISIDGNDLRELRTKDLRNLIGNVNQEAILFNDTIFNNISFGVENATMEQVIAAAKIANAHDFIMEKEDGYMTSIGDRGGKLSGGQRQRISIARAILANPDILILDEATSALDTESERLVQEALDRLTDNRTTIAIAHRLSTIRNADEIIVMNEGRIVERGRHEELIALNGYYRKLNDMQAL